MRLQSYDGRMRMTINGVQLHYREHGPADGLPVLLIHGFPLCGDLWRDCLASVREDVRAIMPDLRGFGSSQASPVVEPGVAPPLSIAQFADDLFLLLEHLGESQPVVVVGHSMGGYVALEFHRRFASRVRAMALVDTRAQPDAPQKIAERHATAARVLAAGSEVVANAMAEKLFGPDEPRELRERWRVIMAAQAPESVAAALYAMAGRGGYLDVLPTMFCPSLIIVGEHDAITPVADAELMQRSILTAKLRVIPAAGHMTPVEQPQAFADALNEFLEAHATAATAHRP